MGAERITDAQVAPGQQFRIGATVFEVRSGPGEVPSLAPVGPTARATAKPADAPPRPPALAFRVVEGSASVPVGQILQLTGELATLGRSETCDIIVGEKDVSRRHARVERTPEGLRIVDLDSAGGVWMGAEPIKDKVLQAGDRVRLGRAIVLEVVPAGGASSSAAPAPPARPVVPAPAAPPSGAVPPPIASKPPSAPIPPPAPSVPPPLGAPPAPPPLARQPAAPPPGAPPKPPSPAAPPPSVPKVAAPPPAVKPPAAVPPPAPPAAPPPMPKAPAADPPSAATKPHPVAPPAPPKPAPPPPASARQEERDATQFIVAQGNTPAPHPMEQMRRTVGPGVDIENTAFLSREAIDATRMGGTGFFRRPDMASGEHEVGQTFMMPALAGQAEKVRRIEDEGELVEVSAHRPFLLDDPDSVFYVAEGGLLIFTVALEKGAPVGQRTHFLGIGAGQCCFGFDLKGYALGSGFLVVPKQGSKVRKIPITRLQQLARSPQGGEGVAALIDTWVGGPLEGAHAVDGQAGQRAAAEAGQPT